MVIQVMNDKHIIFCSHTRSPQSLLQLRDKIHLTDHHHRPGCGCSCTPACLQMGTAMRGSQARKSPCQPHVLLSSLFSSQNKSACAWMAGEWCQLRLRLWRMPHNKEPLLNQDDQCSCHLAQSPEACQARSHQSLQCKPTA